MPLLKFIVRALQSVSSENISRERACNALHPINITNEQKKLQKRGATAGPNEEFDQAKA